ncbi:MAG: hypothetical protein AB9866_03695 [Syntrophobacteraceae bacterium]
MKSGITTCNVAMVIAILGIGICDYHAFTYDLHWGEFALLGIAMGIMASIIYMAGICTVLYGFTRTLENKLNRGPDEI